MKYDIIFSVATDAIRSKAMTGANILPDDTVCVLITNTDKTYTGFNLTDVRDGKLVAGCSEKEAVKNLLSDNDNIGIISAMVTLNCITMIPVLPCRDCVDLITGINDENTNTLVISPDKKYIKITDVDKYKYDGDNSEIESIDEIILSDPLIMASPINNVMNADPDIAQSPFIQNNKVKPLYFYPDSSGSVIRQQESVDVPPYQQFNNSAQYAQNNLGYQSDYPQYSQNIMNSQYPNQQYINMQYTNSQYPNQQYGNPQYINSQYVNSQYMQGIQNTQYINPMQSNISQQFIPDLSPSDDEDDGSDLLQDKLNNLLKTGYGD